jgi:peptidoglycan-N-acetylglucosamine deacetylase
LNRRRKRKRRTKLIVCGTTLLICMLAVIGVLVLNSINVEGTKNVVVATAPVDISQSEGQAQTVKDEVEPNKEQIETGKDQAEVVEYRDKETKEDINNDTNKDTNKETDKDLGKEIDKDISNEAQNTNTKDNAKAIRDMLKKGSHVNKDKKVAYLTFDDGPSTTITPKVLDILKDNSIKATFFVLGNEIDKSQKSKEILKRIANEGHAIANHTYTHNYKKLYPGRTVNTTNFIKEIEKTNESIKNVLGPDWETNIIRFPGGHGSWKGTKAVDKLLDEKGYVYIEWNCLTGDSEGGKKSKAKLMNRFKETKARDAKNGDLVILMHDNGGKEQTVKALPEIIKQLKSEGYKFQTIN